MLAKNFAVSDAFETTSSCFFFVDHDATRTTFKRKFHLGRVVELAPRDHAAPNSLLDSANDWLCPPPPHAWGGSSGSGLLDPNKEPDWLNYLLTDAAASPIMDDDNVRSPSHFTSVTDRENECGSDRSRHEGHKGEGDDLLSGRQRPDAEPVSIRKDPTLARLYHSQRRAANVQRGAPITTDATRRHIHTKADAEPVHHHNVPKSERWLDAEARVEQLIQSKFEQLGVERSVAAKPTHDHRGGRSHRRAAPRREMAPQCATQSPTTSLPPLSPGGSLRDRWKMTSEHFQRIAAMTNPTATTVSPTDCRSDRTGIMSNEDENAQRHCAASVTLPMQISFSSLRIYNGYVSPLHALNLLTSVEETSGGKHV